MIMISFLLNRHVKIPVGACEAERAKKLLRQEKVGNGCQVGPPRFTDLSTLTSSA
jgi:hypothetical protein